MEVVIRVRPWQEVYGNLAPETGGLSVSQPGRDERAVE
jgi:hypothetical protein